MTKIISANLNGIRSASKKGFFEWMAQQEADFICVQELKAQASDMTEDFLSPHAYHGHFHYAEKKGYSGTGVGFRSLNRNLFTAFPVMLMSALRITQLADLNSVDSKGRISNQVYYSLQFQSCRKLRRITTSFTKNWNFLRFVFGS